MNVIFVAEHLFVQGIQLLSRVVLEVDFIDEPAKVYLLRVFDGLEHFADLLEKSLVGVHVLLFD